MKLWGRGIFLLALALGGQLLFAQIMVLEYKTEEDDELHASSVHWIACQNSSIPCRLEYLERFDDPQFIASFEAQLKKSRVVNMSFTVQKPPPLSDRPRYSQPAAAETEAKQKHQEVVLEYERGSQAVTEWIRSHPQILFVTAAGNGIPLSGGFQARGVALRSTTLLYPQILQQENLVKVASIDLSGFNLKRPAPYALTNYSNYGLELVEVAAPVEPNADGLLQGGTSFAAPYVSRLVAQIQDQAPTLSPTEIRRVLLRSCHVENVAKAIWATEDLQTLGEASIVYQAHFHRMRDERERLQKEELSQVLLVACGGVVVDEYAIGCAQRLEKQVVRDSEALNQSCLEAQKTSGSIDRQTENQLLKLWSLRQL